MKTFKILISVSLIIFSSHLGAQINYQVHQGSFVLGTRNMEPRLIEVVDGVSTMHYSMESPTINGSPYLNEKFMEGKMTIVDGTEVPGLMYRYNIYNDEMQFIINADTASITKPLSLRSLEIGEKRFVYDVYQVSENVVAAGYFEVIEEGELLTILYRREIEIEQDVYVSNYGGGGGTKEFMMKEKNAYYLKQVSTAAQKIYRKKDFLSSITDHKDEVKQYMKDHRISVKKEKDLEALVNYYNSLGPTGS